MFHMLYPEDLATSNSRFLTYFHKVLDEEFKEDESKVVIMVSHGNSVMSFMELCEPEAKKKDLTVVGYCCLSIVKKGDRGLEKVCLGDASHVGCGTSEIIPKDYCD